MFLNGKVEASLSVRWGKAFHLVAESIKFYPQKSTQKPLQSYFKVKVKSTCKAGSLVQGTYELSHGFCAICYLLFIYRSPLGQNLFPFQNTTDVSENVSTVALEKGD